jgi:hypothetical protein
LYNDAPRLDDRCRKILAESHSIYSYLCTAGDAFCNNVTAIAPQAQLVPLLSPQRHLSPSPGVPGEGTGGSAVATHATDFLLTQLSSIPAVRGAVVQILASIRGKGIGTARHNVKGPILIHPGSGGREKCYPIDGFIQLIETVTRHGKSARVLLGEVELERFPAADLRRLENVAPIGRPARYVDLLAEMNNAAAFIGNDSGPAHLAAVTGLPTVTIFGPTNPALWRPIGPRVAVVEAADFSGLKADDIWLVLHRLICT